MTYMGSVSVEDPYDPLEPLNRAYNPRFCLMCDPLKAIFLQQEKFTVHIFVYFRHFFSDVADAVAAGTVAVDVVVDVAVAVVVDVVVVELRAFPLCQDEGALGGAVPVVAFPCPSSWEEEASYQVEREEGSSLGGACQQEARVGIQGHQVA